MYTGDRNADRKDLYKMDDDVLAAELAGGQQAVLTVLIKRHGAAVFRIARWFLKNDDEAQETAQTVFFDVFRNISRFDPTKGTLSWWIRRLAVYRSMDRRKHLQSQGFYSWRAIDDEVGDQVLSPAEPELSHVINELVDKLEPEERATITQTFYEGLTAREIAAKTDISLSKVQRNLRRALSKLRLAFLPAIYRGRGKVGREDIFFE